MTAYAMYALSFRLCEKDNFVINYARALTACFCCTVLVL